MPTYEYACTSCGQHLEVHQRLTDEPLTTCGACGGALRKVFHPAGIVFKGSGFYATDNRSKKSETSSTSGTSSSSSSDSGSTSGSGSGSSSGASSGDSSGGSAPAPAASPAPAPAAKTPSTGPAKESA